MKLGFKVKFYHEDQHQSIPITIRNLTKVFCTSGPYLVVLAWRGDELWCRQAQGWSTLSHTHTHIHGHTQTYTGNNNTWRPKLATGKNWNATAEMPISVVPTTALVKVQDHIVTGSTYPFAPVPLILEINYLKIWPWKSKVKVTGVRSKV